MTLLRQVTPFEKPDQNKPEEERKKNISQRFIEHQQ